MIAAGKISFAGKKRQSLGQELNQENYGGVSISRHCWEHIMVFGFLIT
jgi:hypothetical protein